MSSGFLALFTIGGGPSVSGYGNGTPCGGLGNAELGGGCGGEPCIRAGFTSDCSGVLGGRGGGPWYCCCDSKLSLGEPSTVPCAVENCSCDRRFDVNSPECREGTSEDMDCGCSSEETTRYFSFSEGRRS